MREIIQLMDTASQEPDDDPDGWLTGLVQGPCRYQYYSSNPEGPFSYERARGFAIVDSPFYPELSSWYEEVDDELYEEAVRKAAAQKEEESDDNR